MGIIEMKKKPEKISKFDRPPYKPPKTVLRPGSMDVLAAPSRMHNTLYYPSGKICRDKEKP
jgi:hypothetical protein